MFERLIENWLSSSNERGYEVPFCQLLMAEGHRVIHLNSHSPTEQGKDIIAMDPKGKLCGYQLKSGDINLGRWRNEVAPEINELIEVQVEHPGVKPALALPFLVTNGRLAEPVVQLVNALNRTNQKRHFKPLRVIVGTELAARFLQSHGRFLPQQPRDFEALLRLFLANGADMLPKARFARFLEGQLDPKLLPTKTEAERAIASCVVLAAYALSPFQRAENHHAVFEGWTITAAYIARLAEIRGLRLERWRPSFDLVIGAARLAMSNLTREAMGRNHLAEGNTLMDGGAPYRARLSVIAGMIAADAVLSEVEGREWPHSTAFGTFVRTNSPHLLLWGESAIPLFVMLALYLERNSRTLEAEGMVQMLIRTITHRNRPRSRGGLLAPYHGVTRCVAALCKVAADPRLRDNPVGGSFTLAALIEFMVRRVRKQTLKGLWPDITHIHLNEMQYDQPNEFYRWLTHEGQLEQWYVERPQRWAELATYAGSPPGDSLPNTLRQESKLAIMFMLVYPHRFCRDMLKLVESVCTVRSAVAEREGEGTG